jgi:hypothetical protein
VNMTAYVHLTSSCNHVTQGRRTLRFVALALEVVTQNGGDYMVEIPLYLKISHDPAFPHRSEFPSYPHNDLQNFIIANATLSNRSKYTVNQDRDTVGLLILSCDCSKRNK